MSESLIRAAAKERKMSAILAPIELIYMVWLMLSVMFDFKVFMISIIVQFILIGLFGIAELVYEGPRKKILTQN